MVPIGKISTDDGKARDYGGTPMQSAFDPKNFKTNLRSALINSFEPGF